LGSRALLNDLALYPLRGQIIRVARNSAENSFLFDDTPDTTTYIIPRSQDIILGGTIQKDNWSLEPDELDASAIMERCAHLRPDLQQAEILEHAVGLRPGRKTVRLEVEPQPGGGLVVHNYGHGGGGITLSWGCAAEVVSLLEAGIKTPAENRPFLP
jgi:D-amino-acid oxidase